MVEYNQVNLFVVIANRRNHEKIFFHTRVVGYRKNLY